MEHHVMQLKTMPMAGNMKKILRQESSLHAQQWKSG
jgi:hypothetical protein